MTQADPAQTLGRRYELGEQIGAGGMGEVFRGTDIRLGRDVAIKVLRSDLARDSAFPGRFRREAQAAAALTAPGIVSVFDTGQDDGGLPYIVMEYVDGRTLREVIRREGRLQPQRALEVGAEICAALEAAHRAGIVHRDIKPGNVMLDRRGAVKVMDFGIARAMADSSGAMTTTADVTGTAAYLSPEQARGEHVDVRSDIYSTGCLLYELLTGTPPFTGDSAVAIAYQHVREDAEPPSTRDENLSPSIDAVVLKAMAKNPANRYQSAEEMRADLLRAREGEQVRATPLLVESVITLAPAAGTIRLDKDRSVARGIAYTVFGLILVGLVVGTASLVRAVIGADTGLIDTPAVVGLDQREAAVILAQQGLTVGKVTPQFQPPGDGAKPFGQVISQSPGELISTRRGGTVALVVSAGTEQTVVPDGLIGLARDEVASRLDQAKLTLGEDSGRDGNFPAGTVLAMEPPPGTQLDVEAPVRLTVATGFIDVPDARGKSRGDAEDLLQKAGFDVGFKLQDDTGEPGRVLSQSPVNRRAERGSQVTIIVSRTPPPPSPSPQPSVAASPGTGSPRPSAAPSAAPSPAP